MVGFYDKILPKNSDIESEYYSFSFASYRANSFVLNDNCYRVVLVLDGIIGIKGLPYGKKGDANETAYSDYEIIEKKAPEGYELDATPKTFTINNSGASDLTSVTITKTINRINGKDEKKLDGIIYGLLKIGLETKLSDDKKKELWNVAVFVLAL